LLQLPKQDRRALVDKMLSILKQGTESEETGKNPAPNVVQDTNSPANAKVSVPQVKKRGRKPKGSKNRQKGIEAAENAKRKQRPREDESADGTIDSESCDGVVTPKKKRGRKGADLFKGVITTQEGLLWLARFVRNHKIDLGPPTVSVLTPQGPIVLTNPNNESAMECFTVTKTVPDTYFSVPEDHEDQ